MKNVKGLIKKKTQTTLVVISRGKNGWGEVEGVKGGINRGRKRLDFGW